MSISTYAELQTAVASWLKRTDLTDEIPDLITLGEKWIFRRARTRDMETALSVSISSGVAAVPADYVEMKHAYIDGTPVCPVQRQSASQIYARYPLRSADGKPQFFARDGSNFIFGPYPDSNYTLKGIYYKRLTTIVSSANALFTANPDLYLFAALSEAEPFLKNDKRMPVWMAKRDQALADVNMEDQKETFSGGPLSMVAM